MVRTRFFDDQIGDAPGVSAGHPLELDLPDMTEFKTALVARSGLTPACERIGVAADLASDWTTPLRKAGFDAGQLTAWLVEVAGGERRQHGHRDGLVDDRAQAGQAR